MQLLRYFDRSGLILAAVCAIVCLGCESERVAVPISKAEAQKVIEDEKEAHQERKEARKAGLMKRKAAPAQQKSGDTATP